MHVGDVLVAGERVADQDGVRALGIELAVGLIGDLKRRKIDAGIEPQRLVASEPHERRLRVLRLARAARKINYRTDTGIGHCTHLRRGLLRGCGRALR